MSSLSCVHVCLLFLCFCLFVLFCSVLFYFLCCFLIVLDYFLKTDEEGMGLDRWEGRRI